MKKYITLSILFIAFLTITGCGNTNTVKTDALKFKEEYESYNGKKNSSDLEYRTVSINENNPFVYIDTNDLIKKIENKETFFVYFGDSMCPWCRSVIEKAISVANDYDIETIYYVKIWDDDHNEILRDTYKIDENEIVVKVKDGTSDYYKLLNYFDNVLSSYTLTNSNGNKITLQEKRIYAPNFIYVKNGTPEILVEGISPLQKDSRESLTLEMLKDEEEAFEELFLKASVCEDDKSC